MNTIEKVARAIHEEAKRSAFTIPPWHKLNVSERESYFAIARAALSALEPSDAMVEAGQGIGYMAKVDVARLFKAMTQTALEETQ